MQVGTINLSSLITNTFLHIPSQCTSTRLSAVPILGALYLVPIMGAMEKSTHTPEYDFLRSELRALREGANLSQRDLAGLLKVPHSWVAKVESGERRIDLLEFCWFVSACGAEPVAVFERFAPKTRDRQSRRRVR